MSDNAFIRFRLVVLVIPVLCLSLLANNTASVSAANSTIRGEVLYNGMPVSRFTNLQLHFLMRNVNSGVVLQTPSYNASTGAYSVSNVPPGEYAISADTWWQHGRPFPGDLDGYVTVNVSEGQPIIEQNFSVQRIIHLISPADNSGEIPVAIGPNLTQHLRSYPPGKIIFSWQSLAEAVSYNATLYEGYVISAEQWSTVPEWVTTTSDTKWEVSYLSPSSGDSWFELELNAYSSNGAWVGKLVAGDHTGYWFGFRFRISSIGQSSTSVAAVSGTTATTATSLTELITLAAAIATIFGTVLTLLIYVQTRGRKQRRKTDEDEQFMRMAIEESKESKDENDGRVHPKVGTVVVRDGKVLATAYRGEIALGDHAEYTALERKLPSTDLSGATIYTTLEPCTSRAHKTPCAERIIQRKIARVVIGTVDPNPTIIGGSVGRLKTAGIEVSFATPALETEIKTLNKSFLEHQIQTASKEKALPVYRGRIPNEESSEFGRILASLKVHYKNVIQRMEEWDYWANGSGEMIRRKPTGRRVGPFEPPGPPMNLETDKMHLKEFKQTWNMYSNGLSLGSDFKAKQQKATDSVKLVLQNMIEAKGLTFTDPNWETDKLLTTFAGELIGNVQVELRGGKWRPFEVAPPRDFAPGFLTISTYSFKCNLSTAENFVEILNAVRQLPDVKEKIKDMTDAWEQAMKNRESFLTGLRNDVIEPAKDSDYTDPRLFSGVCDNCKHLKDKLASLEA